MGFNKSAVLGSAVAILFSATAIATPIQVDTGTIYNISSVSDFSNHLDLDGMKVTACFTTGSCEQVVFNGANAAAVGTGWSLSLFGDTFINPFLFSTDLAATSLTLNAWSAGAVFDIKTDNAGSPGSEFGSPYTIEDDFIFNDDAFGWAQFSAESVTYSNQAWLNGQFYGDLYSSMRIEFDSAGVTGKMSFIADTDSVTFVVPAPATTFLLLVGLTGLAIKRRLQFRQR
ncbi:PEP-CTERM sorting domain-containing protein [Alkalimonas sp.]|uniref:PEP-CTERM sorting domain-containing protein n=1 Tax=Alkalimonas sp. TaxID=1872453 RepID=UPI00263B4F72|nr:PEP-CTERM sorting domain-containing protein [Alkalimonas sp.]MCC5826580.1 PEP-CTERM sorting domain-containing protein [Alkalimonas sp.]